MTQDREEPESGEPESGQATQTPSQHSAFMEPAGDLSIRVGRKQIDVERRWEAVSILNDIMTGLWFLTGSILNVLDVGDDLPLYFYLAGSSQLLARAFFRLERRIHASGGHNRSRPRMYRPDVDN
ncbi:YrhK family protein [Demequina sp. SO4-13]|uniref:YrhK family protein n=1 Tax=Demequina sp. SO4-13 TaxID=3401027 RepID=UPI003AF85D2A